MTNGSSSRDKVMYTYVGIIGSVCRQLRVQCLVWRICLPSALTPPRHLDKVKSDEFTLRLYCLLGDNRWYQTGDWSPFKLYIGPRAYSIVFCLFMPYWSPCNGLLHIEWWVLECILYFQGDQALNSRDVTTPDTLMDLIRQLVPPNLIQATMQQYRTALIRPECRDQNCSAYQVPGKIRIKWSDLS